MKRTYTGTVSHGTALRGGSDSPELSIIPKMVPDTISAISDTISIYLDMYS